MKFLKRFIYLEKYNASFHKETPKLSARGASSRRTRRCAVCAVLCAFVVAVLMLGTLSGVLDLTALAVTSAVTVFCVLEFGGAYPCLVWCVSSVCAFLFLPEDGKIRLPFSSLSGLGDAAAQSIARVRDEGGVLSIEELRFRAGVSKAVIEVLRDNGALEGLSETNQITFF